MKRTVDTKLEVDSLTRERNPKDSEASDFCLPRGSRGQLSKFLFARVNANATAGRKDKIECYTCYKKGHYTNKYLDKEPKN